MKENSRSMQLVSWFLANSRSFPWRIDPSPYFVWVSEVMLQQTRAQVVVPYFERWLEMFPDAKTLASSPLEQVIKAWEGLGYYSRARNLHKGAQYIIDHYEGQVPATFADLIKVPGIGRYTAAAILSFGFHQRAVPVDGNVARVVSRFFWIDQPMDKPAGKLLVEQKGDELLDQDRPWVSAEGLIELGATICTPTRPKCAGCPLQMGCAAFKRGAPEALPILAPRAETIQLIRSVALIEVEGAILVKKNDPGKLMADLYEFPFFEGIKTRLETQKKALYWFGQELEMVRKLKPVSHTFTKYKAHLYPYLFQAKKMVNIVSYDWVARSRLAEIPFSSGHRKILLDLM